MNRISQQRRKRKDTRKKMKALLGERAALKAEIKRLNEEIADIHECWSVAASLAINEVQNHSPKSITPIYGKFKIGGLMFTGTISDGLRARRAELIDE